MTLVRFSREAASPPLFILLKNFIVSHGLRSPSLNNIYIQSIASSAGSALPTNGTGFLGASTSAATFNCITGIAAATVSISIRMKGTVSVNAGGTFIPQYTLSAAPGGAYTTTAGSYFKIAPLGASGSATSIGTWA